MIFVMLRFLQKIQLPQITCTVMKNGRNGKLTSFISGSVEIAKPASCISRIPLALIANSRWSRSKHNISATTSPESLLLRDCRYSPIFEFIISPVVINSNRLTSVSNPISNLRDKNFRKKLVQDRK